MEDSPGVAALLTEFTDAARRQCDDAPTEQLWEEVDEVLAHGRVEMLSAEP